MLNIRYKFYVISGIGQDAFVHHRYKLRKFTALSFGTHIKINIFGIQDKCRNIFILIIQTFRDIIYEN